MKLVFGLGNIGSTYKNTRHNVGFWVVDKIYQEYDCSIWKEENGVCLTSRFKYHDINILLAKPTTYMNLSGNAAYYLYNTYQIKLNDFYVITDDINLPLGKIRIRPDGGSGGHNGMKSIISTFETKHFPRFRIGIGNAPEQIDLKEYVLNPFLDEEKPIINESVNSTKEAVFYTIDHDIEKAMNKYN